MKTGKTKLLALIIKQIPFEEMMARRIPDINYSSFLTAKWKCWSLKVPFVYRKHFSVGCQ